MTTLAHELAIDVCGDATAAAPAVRGRKGRASTHLFALHDGGALRGVRVRVHRDGADFTPADASDFQPSAASLRWTRGRGSTIGILPRSHYLLKTLELPQVAGDETAQMLRLEVLALLPPEFGEHELSFSELPSRRTGYRRYEAYVARREEVRAYLAHFSDAGLTPDLLIPSAVAWRAAFERLAAADLLVGCVGDGRLESSLMSADGAMHVRTVSLGTRTASDVGRTLSECIRALPPRARPEGSPITIAWVSDDPPPDSDAANVRILPVDELLDDPAAADASGGEGRLIRLFSSGLLRHLDGQTLAPSNLLPAELLRARREAVLRSQIVLTALSLLLAAVLAYAALAARNRLYRAEVKDLGGRVAAIRREGEAVGRRIAQLDAVASARLTRDDFTRVVAALYDATPAGVTYNNVELTDLGVVRLQGQAESLSLTTALPERLEKIGVFRDVQLRDAAQTKKGDVAVAEFRMECKLVRTVR